jgi:hypothetical protein
MFVLGLRFECRAGVVVMFIPPNDRQASHKKAVNDRRLISEENYRRIDANIFIKIFSPPALKSLSMRRPIFCSHL